MAFGHWNTHRAEFKAIVKTMNYLKFAIFFIAIQAVNTLAMAQNEPKNSYQNCSKPLYLTFDTGHMEVAPLIADVLNKHQVKVTFFAANERTKIGNGSLSQHTVVEGQSG
ncbi:MAG: hypothetical protein RI918_1431 [Pseudomonadota bacterium]